MGKIIGCSIIIKDDFNNIMIILKGKKKDPELWQCIGRLKKGKETEDKCINNCIKEDLNTLVFDLNPITEIKVDDLTGDKILLYSGKLKEYMNLGKNVKKIEWINERSLDNFKFLPGEKRILQEYFNNLK